VFETPDQIHKSRLFKTISFLLRWIWSKKLGYGSFHYRVSIQLTRYNLIFIAREIFISILYIKQLHKNVVRWQHNWITLEIIFMEINFFLHNFFPIKFWTERMWDVEWWIPICAILLQTYFKIAKLHLDQGSLTRGPPVTFYEKLFGNILSPKYYKHKFYA